ncbi:MAG: HDOD domain-containing protein [Deltaproteobacteria bacterium]|jgi:HD-like signal output (HDOD) protein|nr:HDOD domain-containing protein [Deltaproteobacteria bacterium]
MRVLLVDDELRVVEGLNRMLYAIAPDWEVETASSGAEALARLAEVTCDVVISDMMMPLMSGAELLEKVRERHPSAARIILSGQTDRHASMRVLNVAHQFLDKPCPPERLVDTVERLQALRRELEDPRVLATVGRVGSLPSAPTLYLELNRLLAMDNPPEEAVRRLLSQEPAMGAKVLQLANSSFFGRGMTVASVDVAVKRLGLRLVRELVLAAEVFRPVPGVDLHFVDALQMRALRAVRLVRSIMRNSKDVELAATAAILADVGQLLERMDSGPPASRSEDPRFHASLGAYLLSLWSLPPVLVEAVARHHGPWPEPPTLGVSSAVYLAHSMVAGEVVDQAFVDALGLKERLPECRHLLEEHQKETP